MSGLLTHLLEWAQDKAEQGQAWARRGGKSSLGVFSLFNIPQFALTDAGNL